jgi:hypothetical protein
MSDEPAGTVNRQLPSREDHQRVVHLSAEPSESKMNARRPGDLSPWRRPPAPAGGKTMVLVSSKGFRACPSR